MPDEYEWWENPREDGPWRVLLGDDHLWATIMRIAEREKRHPSAVLRDIARGTEAAVVEPLSEEDLLWLESLTSTDDAGSMLR